MIFPLILFGAGIAGLVILATGDADGPVPDHKPDLPPVPGQTRWRLVNAILPDLRSASESSGIPLGLLVGWIAKESGGKLAEVTRLDERGYFQLMPSESKSLGLDHQRLSTDSVYSINAGLALIGSYMGKVTKLGVAAKGSSYFWQLVKLMHTMGSGATNQIVAAAQAADDAKSWQDLEGYALSHDKELLSLTRHSPKKWFPFIDEIYQVGAPFGFGGATTVVGASGPTFDDIPDPLDCMKS